MGPEGWLRCIAHPFGGGVCRGHVEYSFCSRVFRSGSLVCVGFFKNLPQIAYTKSFLVAYNFFVLCS